jgi:hypothetical protein
MCLDQRDPAPYEPLLRVCELCELCTAGATPGLRLGPLMPEPNIKVPRTHIGAWTYLSYRTLLSRLEYLQPTTGDLCMFRPATRNPER